MKPILFKTDMVCAILEGRKTVTRRVALPANDLKPFPQKDYPDGWMFRKRAYRSWDSVIRELNGVMSLCKYRPGDILYVRETWNREPFRYSSFIYKADGCYGPGMPWRPSIHMPREAARLFLRVTDVRVERLQDITEEQAVKEGFSAGVHIFDVGPFGIEDDPEEWTAIESFCETWDSTIKPADRAIYGWDANPWVWVIEFERCGKQEETRK